MSFHSESPGMSKLQPVAMLVTKQQKRDEKMTKWGEGSGNSEW